MPPASDALVRVKVTHAPERARWAAGGSFWIPQRIAERFGSSLDARIGDALPVTPREAAALRERVAFTIRRPASARLPVSYRTVPAPVRNAIAKMTGLIGRWHPALRAFPSWPLDLSADLLADLAHIPNAFAHGPAPVLLTHDIDSAEGLGNLRDFLALEERAGARSTNFIVPKAWPLDHGALDEIITRGHELGIHGFDHSHRTPFATPEVRETRIMAAADLVRKYGMTGYRAPSLVRTRELLRGLRSLYAYDSSVPTSGGLFPVAGTGCGSARPFLLEGIAEIPISMPRDGSLRYLGHSPRAIGELWIACADTIAAAGGVVVLLTHCERRWSGNPSMKDAYRRVLEHVAAAPAFRWATPGDVLCNAGL